MTSFHVHVVDAYVQTDEIFFFSRRDACVQTNAYSMLDAKFANDRADARAQMLAAEIAKLQEVVVAKHPEFKDTSKRS